LGASTACGPVFPAQQRHGAFCAYTLADSHATDKQLPVVALGRVAGVRCSIAAKIKFSVGINQALFGVNVFAFASRVWSYYTNLVITFKVLAACCRVSTIHAQAVPASFIAEWLKIWSVDISYTAITPSIKTI
jgi:hypothetical protein